MSSDTKHEVKFEFAKLLAEMIAWIGLVFLVGAGMAWASEGHLETIFEREIPFYNLWMLCSIALAAFVGLVTPRTK